MPDFVGAVVEEDRSGDAAETLLKSREERRSRDKLSINTEADNGVHGHLHYATGFVSVE